MNNFRAAFKEKSLYYEHMKTNKNIFSILIPIGSDNIFIEIKSKKFLYMSRSTKFVTLTQTIYICKFSLIFTHLLFAKDHPKHFY